MSTTAGNLAALLGGTVFGAGLVVAGMTDPDKVLAFLTLDTQWDPSLIFVMGAAVVVGVMGFTLLGRLRKPLFADSFLAPAAQGIDARLLGGAGLFGLGWGIAGFCPGPAVVGLLTLDGRALVFMATFCAGMWLYELWLSPDLKPAQA